MGVDIGQYKEWVDQLDRLSYKDLSEIRRALQRLEKWEPFQHRTFNVVDLDTWKVLITMAMADKAGQYSETMVLGRITSLLSRREWDRKTGEHLKNILIESGWWVEI